MSFNEQIIEEFRANGGTVTTYGFGDGLVLLHTVGARSGEPRINPLAALPEGEGWIVIASAAGNPKHPAWFHNLVARPDEVRVETGAGSAAADVRVLDDAEWPAAWARFTDSSPAFEKYTETAEGRRFPIVLVTPREPIAAG
jgi:deazaflavin-dependent oxidoreductase (nitroreductase family)